MLKVYSVSLGCPKNRVDTEHLLGSLAVPMKPAGQIGRADVVIINTCGFIQPAVEESVRTVLEAVEHVGRLKKRPLLVVAGCMVGRYGVAELAAEIPEVDLWLPNQRIGEWGALLAEKLGLPAPVCGRRLSTGPSYAWLKISDGCRHNCSFCTIPSIRGAHRSVPAAALVDEARALLDQGVREIALVAQDVTAWGEDLGEKHGLRALLERLLPLDGLRWLRLLYLYPAGLTPELLSFIAQAGRPLLPYFDIPMQHADPDILQRMGRPFARDPRRVVDRVHDLVPDAVLRTSLIVGFPGETEAQFERLHAFVQEARFSHLGVFAYRAEEGTEAAGMPDQVEDSVKEWRRDTLMETQAEISAAWLETFVGRRMDVLVDAPHPEWPGLHTGRAWFQAPEIDGMTYISGPGVSPGRMVEADIVESADYDLTALA
ncbi:MAG: 30S ribosomal protein S12 methylthiotransferase RimO [Desulfovibrionaceae bacterium]